MSAYVNVLVSVIAAILQNVIVQVAEVWLFLNDQKNDRSLWLDPEKDFALRKCRFGATATAGGFGVATTVFEDYQFYDPV